MLTTNLSNNRKHRSKLKIIFFIYCWKWIERNSLLLLIVIIGSLRVFICVCAQIDFSEKIKNYKQNTFFNFVETDREITWSLLNRQIIKIFTQFSLFLKQSFHFVEG